MKQLNAVTITIYSDPVHHSYTNIFSGLCNSGYALTLALWSFITDCLNGVCVVCCCHSEGALRKEPEVHAEETLSQAYPQVHVHLCACVNMYNPYHFMIRMFRSRPKPSNDILLPILLFITIL